MLRRISLGIAFAVALMWVGPIAAAEPDQAMVEQYRTELQEYQQAVGADAASKDIEMVSKWIEEAEVLIAGGNEGAAKRRLKRVEFGLDMVRAIVAAEQVRLAAEEQETAAYSAPETAAKLEADIEKLQNEKSELQAELQRLKQAK